MMANTVFLLGAGFSIDAATAAGDPVFDGRRVRYPLVSDLLELCFGINSLPSGQSIEQLFQASIDSGDYGPTERLYDYVMEADYNISPHLRWDGSHPDNVYLRFLTDFATEPLLTFNYDSLVELLLLGLRRWRPDDGYGVQVQAQVAPADPLTVAERSVRWVLHLHGSLCVYPETSYIDHRSGNRLDILHRRDDPVFLFDPDALGHCFFPFERILPGHSFAHVPERAIAPIPDKAKGLKGEFIKATYERAKVLVGAADRYRGRGLTRGRSWRR